MKAFHLKAFYFQSSDWFKSWLLPFEMNFTAAFKNSLDELVCEAMVNSG